MNDLQSTNMVTQAVNKAVSTKVGGGQHDGKTLPEKDAVSSSANVEAEKSVAAAEQAQSLEETKAKVKEAVASLNDYVQSIERDLHFTVDDDTDKTVIKVVDGGSGELIRQIPDEVFLELARKLNEGGEFQMFEALG